MTRKDLESLKRWFSDYSKSFYSLNKEDNRNISLKEKHTSNVRKDIVRIAKDLALANDRIMLAEAIALFHDIGRFSQYAKYKTFNDSLSINHGLLGAKILLEERILQNLPDNEQRLIIESVRFHNTFSLSKSKDQEKILFLKLIRDADKLDIWRVFIEYYESPEEKKASAAGLGLPDHPGYSQKVFLHLYKKRVATLASIKSLNDFKLMQLSWIYDLNFKASLRLLLKRKYTDRMISKLPQTEEIRGLSAFLYDYVRQRLKEDS
ncbi:MAG: HD domain-containing protein [Nitrospirota bacterium]